MKTFTGKTISIAALSSTLVAVCVFAVISILVQKTAQRIVVTGYFIADTDVVVSTVSSNGKHAEIASFMFYGSDSRAQPQMQGTKVINIPIGKLRLDFHLKKDTKPDESRIFQLSSIQVPMPYSVDYYFGVDYINGSFSSDQVIPEHSATYEFDPVLNSATLISNQTLGQKNWPMILGLPVLFFFAIWFLIRNTQWLSIPAFSDMSLGNRISSNAEFNTINGIRGLAALLVLLSHTAPGWESLQIGLGLLFVISGFLLSKPFVLNNQKIFKLANIERYFTKRLKRILPMYYLFIVITYVFTFKFDVALRHFLFVQAEGHLWPMTQIFAFYMLLPFVLLLTCLSHRIHRLLPIIILAFAVYISLISMHDWRPFYNGQYSHTFELFAFLLGVLASYIHYDLLSSIRSRGAKYSFARELVGLFALALTVLTILWSAPMKPAPEIFHYIGQFYIKCLLCVAIIILALNTPGTIYARIMSNWLFRSVGVVGFSFYILHSLGMHIADNFALQYLGSGTLGGRSWGFTVGAFMATYLMAVAGYSYVERPFFGYREKKTIDAALKENQTK